MSVATELDRVLTGLEGKIGEKGDERIGDIRLTGLQTVDSNHLLCNGAPVNPATHSALYAALPPVNAMSQFSWFDTTGSADVYKYGAVKNSVFYFFKILNNTELWMWSGSHPSYMTSSKIATIPIPSSAGNPILNDVQNLNGTITVLINWSNNATCAVYTSSNGTTWTYVHLTTVSVYSSLTTGSLRLAYSGSKYWILAGYNGPGLRCWYSSALANSNWTNFEKYTSYMPIGHVVVSYTNRVISFIAQFSGYNNGCMLMIDANNLKINAYTSISYFNGEGTTVTSGTTAYMFYRNYSNSKTNVYWATVSSTSFSDYRDLGDVGANTYYYFNNAWYMVDDNDSVARLSRITDITNPYNTIAESVRLSDVNRGSNSIMIPNALVAGDIVLLRHDTWYAYILTKRTPIVAMWGVNGFIRSK